MNRLVMNIIAAFCAVALPIAANAAVANLIPDVPNMNPTRSDPGYNTPAGRDWIREEFKRQWKGQYDPEIFLPFIHPTINAPLMDGVLLETPRILTDASPLAQWGFVDVTAPPFGADPTGKKDSTRVLQAAINFACAHQMVCYFPPGVYLVSDTLFVHRGLYLHQAGVYGLDNFIFPNVLVGSTRDPEKRARLVLQNSSSGFDDPEKPKPVVNFFSMEFYPRRWPESLDLAFARHDAAGDYNNLFAGIDIEIGAGNPGAAGIHTRAAEGSSIQDVTIFAGDGHCGLLELTGSGGSYVNITVIGGRYGIDADGEVLQTIKNGELVSNEYFKRSDGTQATPTITGLTLRGQKVAPIRAKPRDCLVLVGARIESEIDGPFIQINTPSKKGFPQEGIVSFTGQLLMVDSRLERVGKKSDHPLIFSDRSVVLQNVYTKGADRIVGKHGSEKKSADGWTRYKHLVASRPPYPENTVPDDFIMLKQAILVHGEDVGALLMEDAAETPPMDLCSRHIWETGFTHWDSPGVVNVKEAPYFAKGDGIADDTETLQRAINENEALFFPKGLYNISRTLKLKPNTKLIGTAMHLSLIYSRNPEGYFYSDKEARPLVETADDPDAETLIAMMGFRINCERPQLTDPAETKHYAVKWQSGGKSIWRFNYVNPQPIIEYKSDQTEKYESAARQSREVVANLTHPAVLITGNGGGRWYNFFYENYWPGHPIAREKMFMLYPNAPFIRIENTATELRFYHFLLQHMPGAERYHCEINKASSVKIYGIKAEPWGNFLKASDCDSIEVMGVGGTVTKGKNFLPGRSFPEVYLVFENCARILVAAYAVPSFLEVIKEYTPLLDHNGNKQTKLDWFMQPLFYKRSQ